MSKVWFITGASKGLGLELAKALLGAGQKVAGTGRKLENLKELTELKEYSESFLPLSLDVAEEEKIYQAVDDTVEKFGRIDVVVNNAGYGLLGELESYTTQEIDYQLKVLLYAPIFLTKRAFSLFRAQNEKATADSSGKKPLGGTVIQITSIGAYTASAGLSIYQGAKAGLEQFSDAAVQELDPSWGIDILSVRPGGFRTSWSGESMVFSTALPEYKNSLVAQRRKHGSFAPINDSKKLADIFVDYNARAIEYENKSATSINGWTQVIKEESPNEKGTGVGGLIFGPEAYELALARFKAQLNGFPKQKEVAYKTTADDVDVDATLKSFGLK